MRFPNSIDQFLPASGAPVIAKARRINDLGRLCAQFLPPALARHARVANFKDGTLIILADNSAMAAKLKLFCESLGVFLAKQRPEINSVCVRVQPGSRPAADPASAKTCRLSPAALRELSALYARLSDSPARAALGRLLSGHGANVGREVPKETVRAARKTAGRGAARRQAGKP